MNYSMCAALCVIVVILIIAYGLFLRSFEKPDILATKVYHNNILQDINLWSVSHFMFFMLLGYLFPGRHLGFILLGVGWEAIEEAASNSRRVRELTGLTMFGDDESDTGNGGDRTATSDGSGKFWYAKESDIIMNTLGYCVGHTLSSAHWDYGCDFDKYDSPSVSPSVSLPDKSGEKTDEKPDETMISEN